MTQHTIHEGRNIKRFREMLGIKQESLAGSLGNDWTQKKISQLEDKIKIEPAILEEVSAAMKIPVEAFQNFDEEQAINVISSTFHDSSVGIGNNYQPAFNVNPIEKWMEALEENKKLYERLLSSEQQKVEMLQGLLERAK